MDGDQTSYCTIIDKKNKSKFVCYTRRKSGIFNIFVTNASEVWSTDFTEDTLSQFRQKFALKSTEDYILKVRSACRRGCVSVSLQDNTAELLVDSSPINLSVSLSSLGELDAREELKELLFRMADSLSTAQTDNTAGSPATSPLKSQQRRHTAFEPRRQHNTGPSVAVKKRLPGDSLINPGSKQKRQATGVTFDEVDDDF